MNRLFFSGIGVVILGVSFIGIDQWMNLNVVIDSVGSLFTPEVWVLPIAGIATAIAMAICLYQIKVKNYVNAAFLFVTFALLTAYSTSLSMKRVVSNLDREKLTVIGLNQKINLAQSEYKTALAARDQILADKKKECSTGYGRRCTDPRLQLEIDKANVELAKRQKVLDELGPKKKLSPFVDSLAKVLFFIPKWVIETYDPLILPLALLFAQIGFVSAGLDMVARSFAMAPKKARKNKMDDQPLGVQINFWMTEQEVETGKRPSYRDAGQKFGVAPSTVGRHLKAVK